MDGGNTWTQFGAELKNAGVEYFDISADGNTIYVFSREDKANISYDGGKSWIEKLSDIGGYFISVSPVDSNRVLFAKQADVYLSIDGLETEKKVVELEEVKDKHFTDIVIAPSNPSIVYAISTGAYPDNSGYDLNKSNDAGETFIKIANLRDDVLNVMP